jgi:hypothetical protein
MHLSRAAAVIGAVASVAIGAAGGLWLTSAFEERPPEAVVGLADAPNTGEVPVEVTEALVSEPPAEAQPAAGVSEPSAPPRPAPAPRSRPSAPPVSVVAAPPASAPAPPPPATTVTPIAPAAIEPIELPDAPPAAVAPPEPQFEELVLSADSVIGLQIESAVSSESAQVEDEVVARVVRDVTVGSRVAVAAGSKAHGEVVLVERGGKMRERARLGVRFTSIVLADGTRIPISTEPIYRDGESPGRESATKIGGGAIGGAIIGGILGGAKGAAIGGSIGAGAGSAVVLAGSRNPATLSPGSPVTVRLDAPAAIVVPR